jgi:hypothetical protein
MGDYRRTTRERQMDQLQPEVLQALKEHIRKNELGDIESDALFCCETTNERIKGRTLFAVLAGFDADPVHYVGAVVTPRYLIWTRYGTKSGAQTLSGRLSDLEVRDSEMAALVDDNGLEITGVFTGAIRRMRATLWLGTESDADQFRSVLKEAVEKAHP